MMSSINIYQKPIKLTVLSYVVVMWLVKGILKLFYSWLILNFASQNFQSNLFLQTSFGVYPSMHPAVRRAHGEEMWPHWTRSAAAVRYCIYVEICGWCHHHHVVGRYAGHVSGALIDARSVSSLWCVSDTTRNKGVQCRPPPQFTAMPPPSDSEGLWFDMRQPTVSLLNV